MLVRNKKPQKYILKAKDFVFARGMDETMVELEKGENVQSTRP